jgi:hypothetical protein
MTSIDSFTFNTRVVPVLAVCLAPLVLFVSGAATTSRLGIGVGVTMTVLAILAGQLGRDRGRALQARLWEGWGGGPAVSALRYRDATHPDRVAYTHECVSAVVDIELPNVSDELADPPAADVRYDDAVRRLIARTRDKEKFALLRAENQNYNQRRNLLGLKPVGMSVDALTFALSIALFAATGSTADDRLAKYLPAALAALAMLAFWIVIVRPAWVRVPADAYAQRLLEAAETLVSDQDRDSRHIHRSPLYDATRPGR